MAGINAALYLELLSSTVTFNVCINMWSALRGRDTGILVFISLCVCHVFRWPGYPGHPASLISLLKRCSQMLGFQVTGYLDTQVSGYSG